jgi:hypothetical protein
MDAPVDRLLTEDAAFKFLVDLGLPIGRSTWHKWCLTRDVPIATIFNGRKLRDPVALLEWVLDEVKELRAQRAQAKRPAARKHA